MRRSNRFFVALSFAIGLGLFSAGIAMAEGGFDTFVQEWDVGNQSRVWADKNVDAANTTVQIDNCRTTFGINDNQNFADIIVYKSQWGPDPNLGQKRIFCFVSGTGNWGRVAAGDYYFYLANYINGAGARFNANPVKVRY